jgi:hypothetical protein
MRDTRGRSAGCRNIAEERAFAPVSNHLNGRVVPQALCDHALRS